MVPLLSMEDFRGKRRPEPGSSLFDTLCWATYIARKKYKSVYSSLTRRKEKRIKLKSLDDHDKDFQSGSTSQTKEPNSSMGKQLVLSKSNSVGTIRGERSSLRANHITSSDSSLMPKRKDMKVKEEKRSGFKMLKLHIRAPGSSTNPNDLPERLERKIVTFEGTENSETAKTEEPNSSMGKELVVSTSYSVGTITSFDSGSQEMNGLTRKTKNKKEKKSNNNNKKSIDGGEDDKDWSLKPKPKDMKRSGFKRPKEHVPRYSTNPNDLPEGLKRKIETLEGIETFEKAKMTLVIQKRLFKTDMVKSANRLSMPLKQIKPESFLDEDEIKFLADQEDWAVSVISPQLEEEAITFRQWIMEKENGSVSSSYVLKTRWNEIRDKNRLKLNDLVQVWSFRDVGNNLHFALVLKPMETDDASGSSGGDGCSLPSSSRSTTSPSNNDHEGEKSSCDIGEREEEKREQDEYREIKDDSSSGSKRSSTPCNNVSQDEETGFQSVA